MSLDSLFDYARSGFKDIKTYFFHNTVYGTVWKDPGRRRDPQKVPEMVRMDPDARLIIVGDASMAPYELLSSNGSLYLDERSGLPSIDHLQFLAGTFSHAVWLNPVPARMWHYTRTIQVIREVFPMFELTLDGLDEAVTALKSRH